MLRCAALPCADACLVMQSRFTLAPHVSMHTCAWPAQLLDVSGNNLTSVEIPPSWSALTQLKVGPVIMWILFVIGLSRPMLTAMGGPWAKIGSPGGSWGAEGNLGLGPLPTRIAMEASP